ncbi:hypothetical protein LCGC14_1735100 [marine sediment metagenome]|uniref:OmpA-like domain-containing protein n=1 Tax=marine sediment metagenome TaxID=412755 RepID=A0A0F9HW08_9ZZZZ
MSASNANPVDWKQRFVADVKRDKKKAAIMAALTVAAVVVVGRVLLKQSSPKPARAVSAAPDSSGSTSGSPGAGPVVAALTGGAVRDRRARRDEYLATMDRRIERDLFKPNLEYFPLATGSSRVTVEAGTTGLGWFDEVRLYVVEQQRAQDRRLAHIQTVRAQAGALSLTGPCGVTTGATEMTLKTEDYPLTTPFFAYQPSRRLPTLAREFLAYVNSPAAQPVIRRAGFVDQFPQSIPLAQQGDRFANAILRAGDEITLPELQRLVQTVRDMSRLTITFRFEDGASTLDPQSRSNVVLLADALERGVFEGRTLVFIGFSDGQGPAGTNRRLSRERAKAVREAVRDAAHQPEAAGQELEIEAFGEALPMACDEAEWGRGVNRRVEVWLR